MRLINTTWVSAHGPTLEEVHEVFPIGEPVLCLSGELVTARSYVMPGESLVIRTLTGEAVVFRRLEVWGDVRPGAEA